MRPEAFFSLLAAKVLLVHARTGTVTVNLAKVVCVMPKFARLEPADGLDFTKVSKGMIVRPVDEATLWRERVCPLRGGRVGRRCVRAYAGVRGVCARGRGVLYLRSPRRGEATMKISLTVVTGPRAGAVFEVSSLGATLGRSRVADIHLEDGLLSRLHCRFYEEAGQAMVQDLGSSNGTLLNGVAVTVTGATKGADSLFQAALACGRRVRAETKIGEYACSVATLAANEASDFCGGRGCVLLAGGTGMVGGAVLKNLWSAGHRVIATERTHTFGAAAKGAERIPYAQRYKALSRADVVISCTASPHTVFALAETEKALGEKRGSRGTLFLDLSVPPDVDPAVGEIGGCILKNIDGFRAAAAENNKKKRAAAEEAKKVVAACLEEYAHKAARRQAFRRRPIPPVSWRRTAAPTRTGTPISTATPRSTPPTPTPKSTP